jgi:opacity protein-like surface antigen
MKKNAIGIICCCFFLAVPAISFGATGWYGSLNAGVALALDTDVSFSDGSPKEEIEWDAGYTFGGAIGYMIKKFRLEGEVSYQENDVDRVTISGSSVSASGDVSLLTFLANGYYDFTNDSPMSFYLTGGIGASKVEVDRPGGSEDDTVFAYQLGAGVGYAASETVIWDFRYRYLGTADPEFTEAGVTAEAEVRSHNFTVGVRFAF